MFSSTATMVLVALAILNPVQAHLKITSPVPYGAASLDNSPLSGLTDFPCKQLNRQDVYGVTTMNHMAVGEQQTLSFAGSASHGGGTCQLAISLDKQPTASSIWKIIQVYEGGCPTTDSGNGGTNNFTYSVPKGFPNGEATFAWVWYNKVGNREIYMNCAPITVSGGSDSKDTYNSFPDLYVINLPTSECSSVEGTDQKIPFPGAFVQTLQSMSIATATGPSCAASAAAQTKGVSGYKSAGSAPASSMAQPTSVAGSSSSSAAPGAYSAPTSASAAAPSSTLPAAASSEASSAAAPVESSSAAASYPTMTPSSGAGVYGGATTGVTSAAAPANTGSSSSPEVTGEGVFVCHGPNEFGQFANGVLVGGWRPMAAGTTCQNNQIVKRSEFRHAHVRRHAQNNAHRQA